MRAVVQRVLSAAVEVDGTKVGEIGTGLLVLVGAHKDDTDANAKKLADRIACMRVFNDAEGKMNLPLADSDGVLVVSNFTVYGDANASRRPSFAPAAPYGLGEKLYGSFVRALRERGLNVETGMFGADMKVSLVNDGPVTIIVDA